MADLLVLKYIVGYHRIHIPHTI